MAPSPHDNPIELALALGEMRGQLKELVHNVAGKAQRDEAMGRTIAKLESIPDDIKEIRKSIGEIESRMAQVELKQGQEEAKQGLLWAIFKSPTTAWVIALAGLVWASMTGRFK